LPPDGTKVYLPALPIERADLPIPGPVQKPDGTIVIVEEENE
jgi:hypothetical protein